MFKFSPLTDIFMNDFIIYFTSLCAFSNLLIVLPDNTKNEATFSLHLYLNDFFLLH